MALIFPGTRCPICDTPLENGNIFATSGVFLTTDDPLWKFCDAGMHWDCYAGWPHRTRFAKAYVDLCVENETGNPFWGRAYLDDFVFVTVNPRPPIECVSVMVYKTGSDVRVPLVKWADWLANPAGNDPDLHQLEKEALEEARPRLRKAVPDAGSLVAAVDWKAKRRAEQDVIATRAKAQRAKLQAVAEHNRACQRLELEREQTGLTCPHCGLHSKDFRYLDVGPERKSYFICRACGRSFGPDMPARQGP